MINCLDPRQYPGPVKECWAVHQALRSLGFKAEDIYLGSGKDMALPFAAVCLFVVLRTQGKEFVVTLGGYSTEVEADATITQWSTFAQLFNDKTFDGETMGRIYNESNVIRNKVVFIETLLRKGFEIPSEGSCLE